MNNIELYYNILNTFDTIVTTLTVAYCCVIWTRPFLDHKKKAWLTGSAYAMTMLFLNYIPLYIPTMLAYILGTLAVFLVMCCADKKYTAQKLFLSITFFCLRWQSFRIVVYINNEIYAVLFRMLLSKDEQFWFRISVFQNIFGYELPGFLFMYAAVRCILWSYGRKREAMNSKEFLLLSMPSLAGVVSYGVVRYYSRIYERDTGKSIYDLYAGHDLIMSLFTLLSFAVIFVTTYVFRQWKTQQEEDKRREIFSKQMQDLESHIAESERLYKDMRALRHDMGNHLMTLKHLYAQGESEAAEAYAASLQEQMQTAAFGVGSGNPVTDVILSDRKKEMEEKGINFTFDFHYPSGDGINAFDISIILNNGLSNAIEAIERENISAPHIFLCSYRIKNMYAIEIANSFTGILETDEQSGLPVTTKTGAGHGFGLSSIRQAAHKYLGDLEIDTEIYKQEKCCVLRVMLQIAET